PCCWGSCWRLGCSSPVTQVKGECTRYWGFGDGFGVLIVDRLWIRGYDFGFSTPSLVPPPRGREDRTKKTAPAVWPRAPNGCPGASSNPGATQNLVQSGRQLRRDQRRRRRGFGARDELIRIRGHAGGGDRGGEPDGDLIHCQSPLVRRPATPNLGIR